MELLDDSPETRNRDAIGARVIVNDRYLLVRRSGSGGFISNYAGPLLFGLGQESARRVEVAWPDRRRSVTRHSLPDYRRGTVTISKTRGVLGWKPESIDHVESVAKKSAQDLG